MKRGFTILELLTVIIIVGIIMLIALPLVFEKINAVREEALLKNNDITLKAAEVYLMRNQSLIPDKIGSTVEITIEELKESGGINKYVDPYSKEECFGYVAVTKTFTGLSYENNISCNELVKNSIDDKLLLNYTFNDFQEPTINEVSNLGYRDWINDLDINESYIATNSRDGIVTTIEITKLDKHKFKAEVLTGGFYFIIPITNSGYDWSNGGTISANILEYYEAPGSTGRIGIGRSSYGTPSLHGLDSLGNKSSFLSPQETSALTIAIRTSDTWVMPGSYIVFENVQLEDKDYATDYTEESRTGKVLDYSMNENHVDLTAERTPKYEEGGYYYFSGENDINSNLITTSLVYERLDSYTINLWAKRSTDGSFKVLLGGYIGNNISFGLATQSGGRITFRTYDTKDNSLLVSATNVFPVDKWTMITATVEYTNVVGSLADGVIKLYINGESIGENSFENIGLYNRNLLIGGPNYNSLNRAFNGYMDDIRIYGRIISDDEIKNLYRIQRK